MDKTLRLALDGHRQERADELYTIATLLESNSFTPDASPLRDAAGQCLSAPRTASKDQPDAGRQYWGYEINDLRIKLEEQRHLRPRRGVMTNAVGTLCVTVHEYLPDSSESVGNSFGLLRRLDADFFFDGYQELDGVQQVLRQAWHIDTHLHTGSVTHSVHPRFHFQVGGDRLDDVDADIRGVFMPETPRLPCAPLDAILAVDFVLSHYCGSDWGVLRDIEPRYGRLRRNPMQRYWSPYFRIIADGIDGLETDPSGGSASALHPSVCA